MLNHHSWRTLVLFILLAVILHSESKIEEEHGSENMVEPQEVNGLLLMESSNPSVERQDHEISKDVRRKSPSMIYLEILDKMVVIDNGIIQVKLSKPSGLITGIRYNNGIDMNIFEKREKRRGYWDADWAELGGPGMFETLKGSEFKVIAMEETKVEVSFQRKWNTSLQGISIPLNIDIRYILLCGSSGVYSYAILEHLEGWPDFHLFQLRMALKLRQDKFDYMAISDERQRIMPTARDRQTGQALAYPEAVVLTNPSNPSLQGEVDDKYMYSSNNNDRKVHGWISSEDNIGLWMITPSDEFLTGGPLKQDLTSHVGPTTLAMFTSTHYAGRRFGPTFRNGEPWNKVFGPVFIYLNSVSETSNSYSALWNDAKKQMEKEVNSWPYSFPSSKDFSHVHQRGSVTGRLLVHDRYINQSYIPAAFAYVGMAPRGVAGSWQRESKGYQFWVKANSNGSFSIPNIRAGDYNLYAWVPHFIGDYKYNINITITPGCHIHLGTLVYQPPRDGPTLWEIGIADRSAAEFHIPNPYQGLMNRLYINNQKDKFRQYGLWNKYTDLYPDEDLIYEVGVSTYRNDWFFAHVPRSKGNKEYEATTWQIKFKLANVNKDGSYKLRLALAAASYAELQVRINDLKVHRPHFTTGRIGRDNAIARHGIHGLYSLCTVDIPGTRLIKGENTIFLTQPRCSSPFLGVMYDYIRLEGPSRPFFNNSCMRRKLAKK